MPSEFVFFLMKRLWFFSESLGGQGASKGDGFKGRLGYSRGKTVCRAAMRP